MTLTDGKVVYHLYLCRCHCHSLQLNCVTRWKGVAESPPSPPHPEPNCAQLNWTEANSRTGGSLLLPLAPVLPCLFHSSCVFFFFFNSLPLTQYQSLSVPMQPFPLFCLPHFLLRPPTQCTTLQPLFPVLSSCMAAESWLAVDAKGQYEKPQCLL